MTHSSITFYLILLISLSTLIGLTSSQNYSQSTRIIGGDNVYEPVPYQISLQRIFQNQWRHFCGGSIISRDFVLTAAHCVNGEDPRQLSILAGVTNLKSPYGSRHYVQGFVVHEEYVPITKCDIAIMKVTPPFPIDGVTIDVIDFTDTTPVPGGIPVTLTGWGSINQTGYGPPPDNLQILTTYTLYNSECQKYFPPLQPTEICALRSEKLGACNGDSGGPLASKDRRNIVAIVAFGTKPCAKGVPDFFTRVSEFIPWIQAKMALP